MGAEAKEACFVGKDLEAMLAGEFKKAAATMVRRGYDAAALSLLTESELSAGSLGAHGAAPGIVSGMYQVSATATPADVT